MRRLAQLVLTLIFLMLACSACMDYLRTKTPRYQVLLMFNTDENDPAYQLWAKKISRELDRQGIRAELHTYYGHMGYTYEVVQKELMTNYVHQLDRQGKRPDLILACGDFMHWQLEINPDPLVCSIPAVCYDLKNDTFLPRMKEDLKRWGCNRQHLVKIHDTLMLQKSLDFAAFLEELRTIEDTTITSKPIKRFITLLDRYAIWIDTIITADLCRQMDLLDTTRYASMIDRYIENEPSMRKNAEGIIQFAINTIKDPGRNADIQFQPLMWRFSRQRSTLRYIQVKHDESTLTMNYTSGVGDYYTMTAEGFLTNPHCVGGHFTSADTLIRDAVTAGRRILRGERPEDIAPQTHTPGYHVNWDVLRKLGLRVSQMPPEVHLYNTTLRDRNPRLATILLVIIGTLSLLAFCISTYFTLRHLNSLKRSRMEKYALAQKTIETEQMLELAIKTYDATLWDEANIMHIQDTLKPTDEWREPLQTFLTEEEPGRYILRFQAMDRQQETHWYELRMLVYKKKKKKKKKSEEAEEEETETLRNGFALNIDKIVNAEQEAREAHRIMIEARTREGFISAMNHEIRTPLHILTGFAMELARPGITYGEEELRTINEVISENTARLKKIINDILLVTFMNNVNITARRKPCTLKSLLVPTRWEDGMAIADRQGNPVYIQPGGDDITMNVDPTMVTTVMDNLIHNAAGFSQPGDPINVSWKTQPDGSVSISVQDRGIGIKDEHRTLIFERFFKVDSFHPGCGLGLYICHTYMQLLGGTITLESTPGKGSTFTLTFKP
ncbi:MAG: HAMP domain-containing sensor histidine kinase [Bacteroidales bacterium]|nr:HAMP domain-containing sensor histidine kinase [Bacteroidales bacterium]